MSVTDQITALTADKTAIENAIIAKGGTLSQNCGFDTFADDIGSIPATVRNDWEVVTDYIHSGNLEVQATAFDISTGVYTAENHGLSNGDLIIPVLNDWKNDNVVDLSYTFIPQEFFANVNWTSAWGFLKAKTVTVVDDNSFTVDISSYDTTKNTNIDVTKWHFEKVSTRMGTIYFNNIDLQNYNVMIGVKLWSTRGTIRLANFIAEKSYIGKINIREYSHWGGRNSIPLTVVAAFGFGNIIVESIDGKLYGTVQNITLMRNRKDAGTVNNGVFSNIMNSYAKCDLLHDNLTSLSQITFDIYYTDGGSYAVNGEEVYVWKKRK